MEQLRGTRVEINLDHLKHNLQVLRDMIGPNVNVMAIIKADAYGHGAVLIMEYLLKYGIRHFGVASLNEALELRRVHKDGEILVLGLTPDRLLHHCVENNITQACCSLEQAKILSDCATAERPAKIQIKLDTGLHRLGFAPTEESMDIVAKIAALPNVRIEGIFSHLAVAGAEADSRQGEVFQAFIDGCTRRGITFPLRSINDGLGVAKYPHMYHNMVRPGSFFYGLNPYAAGLIPMMQMKSEIAHLQVIPAGEGVSYGLHDPADHERIIATLPFGYVDGYPRALSRGKGWVSIKGVQCPVVGTICMDQMMVDVTDVPDVQLEDEVLVFSHEGGALNYYKAAELTGFNRNGLQSSTNRRVPRVYLENGEVVAVRDYLLDSE